MNMSRILIRSLALIAVFAAICECGEFKLTIFCLNDFHSQIFPYTVVTDSGTIELGGAARLVTALKRTRRQVEDSFFFNTGDLYIGKRYYQFHGELEGRLFNLMGCDAIVIGNHELDYGQELFAKAIESYHFPVLASNVSTNVNSPLHGKMRNLIVLELEGNPVAVFGLLTPDTKFISFPGDLEIETDVVKSARYWAEKAGRSSDFVVLLSHCGTSIDKKLARQVAGIDLIIGGHSHHLYRKAKDFRGPEGERCLVVQTGAKGGHLGKLYLRVKNGQIVEYNWSIIPITADIPEDAQALAIISDYPISVDTSVIGYIKEDINTRRESTRTMRSSAGELFCRAMLEQFPDARAAMINSGAIRGNKIYPAGPVTMAMIEEMHPFHNTIVLVEVSGEMLKRIFERSVSALPRSAGFFLQTIGIEYEIDLKGRPFHLDKERTKVEYWGDRIKSLKLNGETVQPENDYRVVLNNYILNGGDGYVFLKEGCDILYEGISLNEAIAVYIMRHSAESRIGE